MYRATILKFVICWSIACLTVVATAQDKSSKNNTAAPKLPADACLYATLHVKEIVAMPDLKLVPWEIITAAGLDELGFDPLVVERLDVIVSIGDEPPAKYAFVARTREKITPSSKAYQELENAGMSMLQLGDRFVLVGDKEYLEKVANGPVADGDLKKFVARIGDPPIAWCAVALSPIQKITDEILAKTPELAKADLQTILSKTKLIAARVDMKDWSIPVVFEANNDADAIAIEKAFNHLVEVGQQKMNDDTLAKSAEFPEQVGNAVVKYSERFLKEFKRVAKLTRTGSRLTIKLNKDVYDAMQMGMNLINTQTFLEVIDSNMR